MPYIELPRRSTSKLQLHYQDFGEGKPLIFIHGWPLSSRTWEAQVGSVVDAGYRAIVYDRRGFGGSSQPWEGYDYDTFAQDLNILINDLDLQDVTLIGFSMGGGEVARYIGKYGSEMISKAVFAAAVTPYLFRSIDNPEGAVSDQDISEKQSAVKVDRLAFLEEFAQKFFTPSGGELAVSEAQKNYAKAIAAFASPKGTHDCVEAFSRTDFRDDLKRINVPTLVIHGDSDQIVPFESSGQRTHKEIAGSELHIIKGGPHGCNISHADEFNRTLINFLSKN